MTVQTWLDIQNWANANQTHVIGVDEAGRGPLFGPVVAGATLLANPNPIEGLACSKKLSEKKRESLYSAIQEHSIAWSISQVNVPEIDRLNILQASLLAIHQAVDELIHKACINPSRCIVLVDGNKLPQWQYESKAMIKGDTYVPAISAGSILAKVFRDRWCKKQSANFPMFKLDVHKGYPTAEHLALLNQFGPTCLHRQSFGPVKRLLDQGRTFEVTPQHTEQTVLF